MPRLVDALPKYRKHKASGQAVVTLNGRDNYLGPHGTSASKAFYDRLIAEWLIQGRRVAAPTVEAITIVMLCGRYLRFAKDYYLKDGKCTGTVPAIKSSIKYLRDWYGRTPAADFGPLALKAIRQKMVEDGLSRTYVNDHVARIKRMFKWGVSEQLVPPATYQGLASVQGLLRGRTTAHENPPILPVDDAIVDATLPFMPEVTADMVRLQRLTGMRPAEVCIIRPCDVDRSGDVWLYRPASHKTEHHGRDRVVFIGAEAQGVLLRYLAREATTNCFRPCDSMAKVLAAKHAARVTPLSCGNVPGSNKKRRPKKQPGEQYEVDQYRRSIHRACDKAFPHPELGKIKRKELTPEQKLEIKAWQSSHRWAPNRLRHTFATQVRKEFGLEAAQVTLGHSSAVVSQIYAERDLAKGVQVAKAIG
jgi:integrase